jgi:hypothetical protein
LGFGKKVIAGEFDRCIEDLVVPSKIRKQVLARLEQGRAGEFDRGCLDCFGKGDYSSHIQAELPMPSTAAA